MIRKARHEMVVVAVGRNVHLLEYLTLGELPSGSNNAPDNRGCTEDFRARTLRVMLRNRITARNRVVSTHNEAVLLMGVT